MSKERTRHVLVCLVVLLSVSVVAAPALATPTDSASGTTIDDTLSDDSSSSDSTGTNSSDGSSTDDSDDGSTAGDGTNTSDDSTDDDGSSSSSSSDDDSDSPSRDWGSSDSGANSSDGGNESDARLNLTESVNETLEAADGTLGAETGVLGGAPSGLSVESLSELGSNGTATNATAAVSGSGDDGGSLLDSTTDGADGLLEATVASVMGTVDGRDGTAGGSGGAERAGDASDGSGPAFLAANVPGGADEGGAAPGPTAGIALGVGAVAAAAVTRQGALFPGLTAEVGATAMSALAVPGRVRGGLDRLLRTVAPFRYSRYDDSDPLEHEARAEVFSVVEESPGAYLSELAERAEVPLSTARHHVRILEREDLVSGAKVRGKRRFYPAYETDVEIAAAMNDEATAAVIDALARLGASSVSALADEVERDPSTVTHHLQRLEEDEIVVREREGRSVVNRLSPEARTALEPEAGEAEPAEAAEALASD